MLGCGTHRAAVFDRCESAKVADLDDVISGEWERLLDSASQATVEVGRNGDCCRALDQIVPWRHELVIWRDDEQVWSGPLMDPEYGSDSTVLRAQDRWAWLDVHAIREDMELSGDYTDIAARLLRHALTHPDGGEDETCILPALDARATGVLTDVEYKAYQRSVGAELRNLVRGPLNATFLGRRLVLFGTEGLGSTAMLQDKDFLAEVTVVQDGYGFATRVIVVGDGVVGACGGTHSYYGLVERIINDSTITSTRGARALACAELEASKHPPLVVSVPNGARLSPSAPVTITELVPGVEVPVWSSDTCRTVNQNLVLERLRVSWDSGGEEVAVTLSPGSGPVSDHGGDGFG